MNYLHDFFHQETPRYGKEMPGYVEGYAHRYHKDRYDVYQRHDI